MEKATFVFPRSAGLGDRLASFRLPSESYEVSLFGLIMKLGESFLSLFLLFAVSSDSNSGTEA